MIKKLDELFDTVADFGLKVFGFSFVVLSTMYFLGLLK
jgi:hypothetical protein